MTLDKLEPGMSGKVAPMKDPIELYLRSYVLTIRKDDAAMIEVEVIDNGK